MFWCTKGKTGSRGGFAWSVPRYCGTLDLLQVLGADLNKVRPRSGADFRRWHWLGFDSATAQPVGTAQCVRILRPHLSAAMDVTSLSSYSFRRVLPTLAGYVGLSETERLALGQWVDQSSKTSATTPLRYDSQKQRLGHQLRLAGLNFFQDLNMALWDELPTGYASARWATCMGDADELLARHARGQDSTSCSSSSHPSYGSSHHCSAQAEAPGPSRGSPPGGRAPWPRTTVSTFSFSSPSRPVKRARVESPPKASAGGSAQPVTPPKAPPPKVPPMLPLVSSSSASAATPSLGAPPPLPSTSPRASSSPAAAGPSSAPPPAPKIKAMPRAPPPAPEGPQQLQEANDAAFDAAARERWRRPGHSGAPEPPTLIFMGEAGNGSIYLGGLPTDRAWLETHNIGLSLSAMDKIAADCRGGVSTRQVYQFNAPVGHQGALRDRQLKLVLPIFLATLVLVHCMAGVHRAPCVGRVAARMDSEVLLRGSVFPPGRLTGHRQSRSAQQAWRQPLLHFEPSELREELMTVMGFHLGLSPPLEDSSHVPTRQVAVDVLQMRSHLTDADVYIGPGHFSHRWPLTQWQNPFRAGEGRTALESVLHYARWIADQDHLMADLSSLHFKNLVCDCPHNVLCHGDILRALVWTTSRTTSSPGHQSPTRERLRRVSLVAAGIRPARAVPLRFSQEVVVASLISVGMVSNGPCSKTFWWMTLTTNGSTTCRTALTGTDIPSAHGWWVPWSELPLL